MNKKTIEKETKENKIKNEEQYKKLIISKLKSPENKYKLNLNEIPKIQKLITGDEKYLMRNGVLKYCEENKLGYDNVKNKESNLFNQRLLFDKLDILSYGMFFGSVLTTYRQNTKYGDIDLNKKKELQNFVDKKIDDFVNNVFEKRIIGKYTKPRTIDSDLKDKKVIDHKKYEFKKEVIKDFIYCFEKGKDMFEENKTRERKNEHITQYIKRITEGRSHGNVFYNEWKKEYHQIAHPIKTVWDMIDK